MNIKTVGAGFIPIEPKQKTDDRANVQANEASSERDADGRSDSDGGPPKRELSEQELREAVEYLESLSGFKENHLQIRLSEIDGLYVIFIEDIEGNTVRRIPASEVWQLLRDRDNPKGQILNKAM